MSGNGTTCPGYREDIDAINNDGPGHKDRRDLKTGIQANLMKPWPCVAFGFDPRTAAEVAESRDYKDKRKR